MTRRRRRLLALAASTAAGLALAEGALRLARPQPTFARLDPLAPRCFVADDVVPRRLLPGARVRHRHPDFDVEVAVDGQGLRMDREVTRARPPGARRVVVVGDSFTFGWGVEGREAFPALLEARARAAGRAVEVLNLGFALGFSPDAYVAGLRADPGFEADVLVVQVFVGNDLAACAETAWPEVGPDGLPRRVTTPFARVDDAHRARAADALWRYRVPLLRDSHLAVGLARLLTGDADPGGRGQAEALARVYSRDIYAAAWPAWLEALFARTVACLRGLARLAAERGQRCLVVVAPDGTQLYRHLQAPDGAVVRELRAPPGPVVPQARLAAALAPDVAVLDLLPALAAAGDLGLYFPRDGHWTARGHAVVAATLEADLAARGWLGPP